MALTRWARAHLSAIINTIIYLMLLTANMALLAAAFTAFLRNLDDMDAHAKLMNQPLPSPKAHVEHHSFWSDLLFTISIWQMLVGVLTVLHAMALTLRHKAGCAAPPVFAVYWVCASPTLMFETAWNGFPQDQRVAAGIEKELKITWQAYFRLDAVVMVLHLALTVMVYSGIYIWVLARQRQQPKKAASEPVVRVSMSLTPSPQPVTTLAPEHQASVDEIQKPPTCRVTPDAWSFERRVRDSTTDLERGPARTGSGSAWSANTTDTAVNA